MLFAHRSLARHALAAFILSSLVALNGCEWSSQESSSGGGEVVDTTKGGLQPFASRSAFEDYLKRALAAPPSYPAYYDDGMVFLATAESSGGARAFSTTTLQEDGVDEADRVKSDGRHLFLLSRNTFSGDSRLLVRRLTGDAPEKPARGAGSEALAELGLPSSARFNDAYLIEQRPENRSPLLLAVGEGVTGFSYPPGLITPAVVSERDWFAPGAWTNGKTELQWIDVADAAAPALGRRISLDGHLVASRRIGETLYVVTRFVPVSSDAKTATLDELLPKWSLDGVGQGNLVDAETCYLPNGGESRPAADLVVVGAFDLEKPEAPPKTQCLVGGSEAVYVSAEGSLYVATTRSEYTVASGDATIGASLMIARYPLEASTDLHKFALGADGPRYRGSGSVAGHLGWEQDKKSFRMGEHRGVLRVATSLGEDWNGSASTRLTLLEESGGSLKTLSTLPNDRRPAAIGKPGERLYAARFVGDRAYLVTFRVTDPLYVLDLSQAADPRIAGELKMPGYSDFLFPLGDRWLIGVGKDAVEADGGDGDGRGAWYQGVKLALFDVADPSAPKLVDARVIGKRGSDSTALFDHHGFTVLPTGQSSGTLARLALPVRRHETPASGFPWVDSPQAWYNWTDTGLHLFTVTDAGLSVGPVLVAEARGDTASYPVIDDLGSDRSLLLDDEAHFIHGDEVWAMRW